MKRVFRFKKGTLFDNDSEMDEFLFDYLTTDFTKCRKNWKVTIIIEEEGSIKK